MCSSAPLRNEASERAEKNGRLALTISLFVIAATALAAYGNVLFNFWLGDDFGLLVWLKETLRNSNNLVRDFQGPWLSSPTAQFYRPLISVSILADYLLYGWNATGYHLTNIIYLIATSIALFYIVRDMSEDEPWLGKFWPFSAALLFALYPAHAETVSWIIGRVDGACIACYFISFAAYVAWRRHKSHLCLGTSLIFAILSLLAKEMGIVTPATIAAYEFLVITEGSKDTWRRLRSTAWKTLPFWLLLTGYFIVRRLTLGTFVGGYDDSLFTSDLDSFFYKWQTGLRNLVIPVNHDLIRSHDAMLTLWQVWLVPATILSAISLCNRIVRRNFSFLLVWFLLSLAPVYKLFTISNVLENSRYGYLASAPLCCALTVGVSFIGASMWHRHKFDRRKGLAGLLALLTLCTVALTSAFSLLRTNNSGWAYAGHTANAIRAQLQEFYNTTAGDPPVLIVNLPDNIHGCYVCRNAFEGMTQTPQLSRNIYNCSMVNQFDRQQPFGYLKARLLANGITALAWNQTTERLVKAKIVDSAQLVNHDFVLSGPWLTRSIEALHNTRIINDEARSPLITALKPRKRPELSIKPPAPIHCWQTDFIAVDLELVKQPRENHVDLEFKNDIVENFDSNDLIRAFLVPNKGSRQTVVFSMRSHPAWALGGTASELKLKLPLAGTYRVLSVRSLPAAQILPEISFESSDWLGSKGVALFNEKSNSFQLHYDCSSIKDARAVQLDLTKRNQTFEWPNSPDEVVHVIKTSQDTCGTFNLRREDIPDLGLFEVRVRALDSHGTVCGMSSDHVILFVTK